MSNIIRKIETQIKDNTKASNPLNFILLALGSALTTAFSAGNPIWYYWSFINYYTLVVN